MNSKSDFVVIENTIPKELSKLVEKFHDEGAKELRHIGDELLRKSGERVPHDEGILQDSGVVKQVADLTVEVGYHTPYAARLHEHPEYNFQKGREGKYLENPLKENLKLWLQMMTDKLSSINN